VGGGEPSSVHWDHDTGITMAAKQDAGAQTRDDLKASVQEFWDAASCGEVYAIGTTERDKYESHARARYTLEPYIPNFAQFATGRGRDVLEVGVGMGADHAEWVRNDPRSLTGVDLTPRAIAHTKTRLSILDRTSRLLVGDAENLPFPDESFDLVYSWGVLHHSPDTAKAIREVHRVLRPRGQARIMIYHSRSIVGALLWMRYGLLTGHPGVGLERIYAEHLESPGTKAYSVRDAQRMFAMFDTIRVSTQLSFGDLLEGEVGQRHRSAVLEAAKRLWPRWLIRRLFAHYGLMLLIEAVK
jgi:SAM-dependent methyltransferase